MKRETHIVGVDLLRFGAALIVMLYHFGFCSWASPGSPFRNLSGNFDYFAQWQSYFDNGWVGVEIFFVISGFVIPNSANGKSPAYFVRSRILRLGPGAWICSSLTLLILYLTWGMSQYIKLEYLDSLMISPAGPWVSGVYWTLGVEIIFYTLIFLVLMSGRFENIELCFMILGAVSTAFWVAYAGRNFLPATIGRPIEYLAAHRVGELLLLQHGVFFALGGFFWLMHADRLTSMRIAASTICVAGCFVEIIAKTAKTSAFMKVAISPDTAIAIWTVAMLMLAGSLVLNGSLLRIVGAASPALRILGLATYPLYLLHDVAGAVIMSWLAVHGFGQVAALLIAALAIVVLSICAERAEHPVRWVTRRILALLDRKRCSQAT